MSALAVCPKIGRMWLVKEEPAKRRALWLSPACHNWSCPVCSEVNKENWVGDVVTGVSYYLAQGQRWYFMTLTMHRKLKTFDYQVKVFHRCWGKWYARIRRLTKTFRYVLIPERGEQGRFHVHLITSLDLMPHELKEIAVASGLGWKVDTERLRHVNGAAYYCTKYLTKSLETPDWPDNFRRIRTSHKWPKTATSSGFDAQKGWERVGTPENSKLRIKALMRSGLVNIDVTTGEVLDIMS